MGRSCSAAAFCQASSRHRLLESNRLRPLVTQNGGRERADHYRGKKFISVGRMRQHKITFQARAFKERIGEVSPSIRPSNVGLAIGGHGQERVKVSLYGVASVFSCFPLRSGMSPEATQTLLTVSQMAIDLKNVYTLENEASFPSGLLSTGLQISFCRLTDSKIEKKILRRCVIGIL